MKSEILCGDCRQVMATMPESSVDSICTDPPYGLSDGPTKYLDDANVVGTGFMGKSWDHGVPGPDYWIAALRVAKPGAYLVAFGGTRSHHRLMCAIEDAGWEIRDVISDETVVLRWEYGQGFPKGRNISADIDQIMFLRWLAENPAQAERRNRLLDWARGRTRKKQWVKVIHAAFLKMAGLERTIVGTKRGVGGENLNDIVHGKPVRSFDDEGGRGMGAYGVGAKQVGIDVPVTEPASDEAKEWAGWNVALKPAWEPIVVARKPFSGSIAANVLAHGTGGLNIDDCRIGGGNCPALVADPHSEASGVVYAGRQTGGTGFDGGSKAVGVTALGRWPANLVLTHHSNCERVGAVPGAGYAINRFSDGAKPFGGGAGHPYESEKIAESIEQWSCVEDCPVRALDEQSGALTSGRLDRSKIKAENHIYGAKPKELRGAYDQGVDGASRFFAAFQDDRARFFYTPKASRSEREHGLHGRVSRNVSDGRKTSIDNPYQRGDAQRLNIHPTVKPVALMRWLVRLVTRKGGTVLDMFCGSGTTGVASRLEGMNFIGIDMEQEHVELSRKRSAQAAIDAGEASVAEADEIGGKVQLGLFSDEMLAKAQA